jgi:hypothetical protein
MKREWFAVMGLFPWYVKSDGSTDNVEECVVLFPVASFDEAIALAETEANAYCAEDPTANFRIEPFCLRNAYRIGEEPKSGAALYSRLCKTDPSSDAFVCSYYPSSDDGRAG